MRLVAEHGGRASKWHTKRYTKIAFVLIVILPAGCRVIPDKGLSCPANQVISTGFATSPRVRFGSYPTATVGTLFLGPNLGKHGYYFRVGEKDGMTYTCRGGNVDVIHVRIAADWTAYLVAQTYRTVMSGKSGFSYKLAVDRSHNHVTLSYPPNWNRLSTAQRTAIAKDVAMALGPYLCYTMTTWHEILTWFGFRCIGVVTEFPSAFSWEDSYSNLLGTIVAVRALQDGKHHYNRAIEIALDEEMKKLGVVSASAARRASERVKGDWFTGSVLFFVDIKRRNFDVGLDDGYVTPTLLPGVRQCPGATPASYPVPTLDVLRRYGFGMKIETQCHEWERGRIFEVLFGSRQEARIDPVIDIPPLMEYIRQDAVTQYGYMVDPSSPRLHARR
jgi:hypothetical protein